MAPDTWGGMSWRQWVLQDWSANAGYPDSRLILLAYRFTQRARAQWGPLGQVVFMAYWLVTARVIGVELSPSTRIGPGLRMPHPHGIVLNPAVRIGARCLLRHNVTIGNSTRRDGTETGVPSIGDDVEFGAGCVVVGGIHVGDHARIAALALVTRDVPPWAVMMGNPAHLVRTDPPAPTGTAGIGAAGIWCTEIEVAERMPPDTGGKYAAVRVLVRVHGVPLGFIEQPYQDDGLDVDLLLKAIDVEFLDAVNRHLLQDGVPQVESVSEVRPAREGDRCSSRFVLPESVSVVVCTRDRPDVLRDCLDRLRLLTYPQLEILIVDNAPSNDATRQVFTESVGADSRFRYVREPRPGLSCARNRGLQEATGALIAYTDDDVSVDQDWVRALAAGFGSDNVACVTGLVCTASIDGPAERYFDARVSWGESCRPLSHRLGGPTDDGLFPYSPGVFGTGASFAVRTAVLRELGGFDEALGAGTETAGGEDLDIFVRIVLAGHTLAYEPAAVVWHHHRSDLDGLRRQMFAYGTGLSAFLAKHLVDPSTRREVVKRIPRGARRAVTIATGTHRSLDHEVPGAEQVPTSGLLLRELGGLALGPVLYARARRAVPPQG